MYKAFYHLQKNPFEITPDPSFLFPTTRHNEALASLYYGVTSHRGFVVLTGEVSDRHQFYCTGAQPYQVIQTLL